MKNYERYLKTTAEEYDKKTVMSYLCRVPSDRKIIPLLSEIANKKILDVGLGTGRYSRILSKNNLVVGVDHNPHLCKLPIKVYNGDATELTRLVNEEKFDIVISTWMTEYLDQEQLSAFFAESKKVLNNGGKLITTIISKYGFGFLYVTAARLLRGIDKYNYGKKTVIAKLKEAGFSTVKITTLNSRLYSPWAYLVIAE